MTAALVFCLAGPACAEPLEATAALSLNALTGQHEVGRNRSDRLSFAPLPLVEVTLRAGTESLRLEGLPPLTLGYFNQAGGGASTRLSLLNATYRHGLAGGWFLGIGQTVYNQNTTYPQRPNEYFVHGSTFVPINGMLSEYSRVTGLRFEGGRTLRLGQNGAEFFAALNPRMHGMTYTRVPTFLVTCPPGAVSIANCSQIVETFGDGESGTQIDLAARFSHHVSKRGEVLLGLRYLNYTARYDAFPGQIADRNVGFAPSLGYRVQL